MSSCQDSGPPTAWLLIRDSDKTQDILLKIPDTDTGAPNYFYLIFETLWVQFICKQCLIQIHKMAWNVK